MPRLQEIDIEAVLDVIAASACLIVMAKERKIPYLCKHEAYTENIATSFSRGVRAEGDYPGAGR